MQIERKGQNCNAGTFRASSILKVNRNGSNVNFVNEMGICEAFF